MSDRLALRGDVSLGLTRRAALGGGVLAFALAPRTAYAASAAEIDRAASEALAKLYAINQKARELSARAEGVLIFPKIDKVSSILVESQIGDGVLRVAGAPNRYYRIVAGNYGLQGGAQRLSLAIFFITRAAIANLGEIGGWAVGSGPSVAFADEGRASTIKSTTLTKDIYAVPFGHKSLMAGVGLDGSKISRITPEA